MNETGLHVLHFNTYFAWKKKKNKEEDEESIRFIKLKG